jgi:hypothetical protein
MSSTSHRPTRSLRQSGQSSVEYAAVCAVLAGLLFAVGSPAGQLLTQAMRDFYRTLTFYLSLP